MSSDYEERRVISPIARLSYPYLFEPDTPEANEKPKYRCELSFEEGTDLSVLEKAIKVAVESKWGSKVPKNLKSPFGETEEGLVRIRPNSTTKPGVVVGRDRQPCGDPSEVYAGCYVRVSLTASAYEHPKSGPGVKFYLNNVWKIKDGEPFGSRRNAEEEFGEAEVDEDAFGEADDSFGYGANAEESSLL